jgi:hypothetical protein
MKTITKSALCTLLLSSLISCYSARAESNWEYLKGYLVGQYIFGNAMVAINCYALDYPTPTYLGIGLAAIITTPICAGIAKYFGYMPKLNTKFGKGFYTAFGFNMSVASGMNYSARRY